MAAIFIVSMSPLIVYAQTSFIPLPAGTLEGRLPNGLRYLILRNLLLPPGSNFVW